MNDMMHLNRIHSRLGRISSLMGLSADALVNAQSIPAFQRSTTAETNSI